MHPAIVLLALSWPTDVVEEWSLLESAPVRQAVLARAVYAGGGDGEIVLPSVFSQGNAPQVSLVGSLAPCPVWRVGDHWRARIPPTRPGQRIRAIARRVDPVVHPRLFRLSWPVVQGEASRRVALLPRGWLPGPPEGWSCADDEVSTLACVSVDTRPRPFSLRVPPTRSTRMERSLSALSAVVSLALAWTGEKPSRPLRLACLGASLLGGGAIGLTLVGARRASWALALLLACCFAAVVTRALARDERARHLGALALVALALLATLDGRLAPVLAVTASFFGMLVASAAHRARSTRTPDEAAAR